MTIDLHTHSAWSDGTDSVPDLVAAARRAGLASIALTDHDTMDGVDEAQRLAAQTGVATLRGMEMSSHLMTENAEHSVHVLAYGCRSDDAGLAALLVAVRQARRTRVPHMLERLAGIGLPLTLAEVKACSARAVTTGRPHIADAMVARGYVADRDEAFRDFLDEGGPAYVGRYTPEVAEAVDRINQAHGVAVLAHPWGRGNHQVLTGDVIARLASANGLYGIEVDHVDHTPADRQALTDLAHDLGLVMTGGSDYHGTGKTRNPLGVCRTAYDVYTAIRRDIEERGGQL